MKQPESRAARYAPAAFLFLCGIGAFFLALNKEDESLKAGTSGGAAREDTLPQQEFKSIRRRAAASAKIPAIRKSVFVSYADKEPITLEEAAAFLHEYQSYRDPESRGRSSGTIIRRLCHSGFTDEAFAAIELPASDARTAGIRNFFFSVQLGDEAVFRQIAELPAAEDRVEALASYFRRMSLSELKELLAESGPVSEEQRSAVTSLFEFKLHHSKEHAEARAAVDSYYRQGWVGEEAVVWTVQGDPNLDPFTGWERLTGLGISKKGRAILVGDMVTKDLPRAMDTFRTQYDKAGAEIFSRGLLLGARTDSISAFNWFESKKATLTDAQHDSAVMALTIHLFDNGRLEEAEKLADTAKNPGVPAELRKALASLAARKGSE